MNDEVIEKLLELRFLTNRHTIQSGLSFNNTNNEQYFQAALEGEADSPGLQYLLNLDNLTLKDQRSISTYNELKLAVYIA